MLHDEDLMVSPIMHRKRAREYLARAEQASDRRRKLKYLRLAVSNTVRATNIKAEKDSEASGGGAAAQKASGRR